MTKKLDVLGIHRSQGIALMNCDCHVPVTEWFDATGQDCEPEDAIVCVCGDEDHGWFTVDLEAFQVVTVH